MSKELEAKVWASALAPRLKPVAAFLGDIANVDGSGIYPSIAYIAWAVGSHDCAVTAPNERTIQRAIDDLEAAKVLRFIGWRRNDTFIAPNARDYDRKTRRSIGPGATPEYSLDEDRLPARRPWRERYRAPELADSAIGDNLTPMESIGDKADGLKVTNEAAPLGDTPLGDIALGDILAPKRRTTDPNNPSIESTSRAPREHDDGFESVDISADERRFATVLTRQTRSLNITPPMAIGFDATAVQIRIRQKDLTEQLGKALRYAATAVGRTLRIVYEEAA